MRVRCPECNVTFDVDAGLSDERIKCPGCRKDLRMQKGQEFVDDGISVLDLILYNDDISIGLVETALDIGGGLLESAADCVGDVADGIFDILD